MTRLMLVLGMALSVAPARGADVPVAVTVDAAQELFYTGQYAEAARLSVTPAGGTSSLALREVRTSALLFQLRRALGDTGRKARGLDACAACSGLVEAFTTEYGVGRAEARERLRAGPDDAEALFFLGKLDLNYVWLVLGPLGRRTGWNEYWEARHSLDAALALRPDYLRARVARAWIDYIVETKTPWGTRWLLGGGNRKKALATMGDAAHADGEFYARAEALFGLWDMQQRERNIPAALETARALAVLFPHNPEVARFVASQDPAH